VCGDEGAGVDYKRTMNLPQTAFPMKASLSQREPEWMAFWDEIDVYRKVLEANAEGPGFVLHDGPPYANGDIHMGTAFNKVLKDLIVKYKSMRGFNAPYVPGWDCHGQPIEHMIEKTLGSEKMASTPQSEIRRLCRDWAMRFVQRQSDEFRRLGVRGDFEDPYLTLNPSYEAGDVRVFADLYGKGMIYKGRKPIHWCWSCKTALAEAEIEYGDEPSDSIYVKFWLTDRPKAWAERPERLGVLIWTTTPWTLPANVAVTLAPDADYVAVRFGEDAEPVIMAEALVDEVRRLDGVVVAEVLPGKMKGSELEGLRYELPVFPERTGVIITGAHVELTTGTGAVHTAPGHGEEDYLVGLKYKLPSPMPVDDHGVFTEAAGPFAGLHVNEANPKVIEFLRERGTLLWAGTTMHSYPHCWRCKKPVIFRATEQWFVSMDDTGLRRQALEAIDTVEWVPAWSINRMNGMVAERPDWCISRQRAWGVPIPVFECPACGEIVANDSTFEAVERLFATEGADAWFTRRPSEYLPPELAKCPKCGGELQQETDILDVWFESGVSHTSVLKTRPELHFPAELYLEGSDQHRGWFQSNLLTSVGAYGVAPFKAVLTHGFIVDGEGRKMSKSIGNTIDPMDVVKRYGADIIRLWVASSDYSQDVSVSDEILDRSAEAYRRIRNTFRFLLSNLYDYTPDRAVAWEDLQELDRYALVTLNDLVERVTAAYDDWRYHVVFHSVFGYCVTDLSAFYLDVLKDRLYSDAADSVSRRGAQTVLAAILGSLVRLIAPVLTFTSEEVWHAMPESLRDAESVQLAGWPDVPFVADHAEEAGRLRDEYAVVLRVRDEAMKALEEARAEGRIGKSQEARVILTVPAADAAVLSARADLDTAFIVGGVDVVAGSVSSVAVEPAAGEKCARCWNHRTDVGVDAAYPDICGRCAGVVRSVEER
jgi:isoleucyl-tRNA synthetase